MTRAAIPIVICTISVVFCTAASAAPPEPLPWRDIPDPAPDAERRLVVRPEDRGPVWLYTGFLNNWTPEMDMALLLRLKPRHWRYDLWPFWHPASITASRREKWNDFRDFPVYSGQYLAAMLRLREQGMTWQVLLHHRGPYYGKSHIGADDLDDFYDHIYTLVRYTRHMGTPIDYLEVGNEPGTGPYEGVQGYGFRGTWPEFLGMWDTAYRAIRDAWPEARIVGPSYGNCTAATLAPFLEHCREQGQTLDVLSWHEITQQEIVYGPNYSGDAVVAPDKAHKNIMEIRRLVRDKYADLGIREIHIDEWGYTVPNTGPGTQIAYFHYFDRAGVDRAAKAHWTQDDLDGILASPKTPRTSYWCWAEYAKQDGGVRLITETDDRCVVALASRHDEEKEVRVLVARAKRHTGPDAAQALAPALVNLEIQGIPIRGAAELTTLTLGPHDGPLWEEDVAELRTRQTMAVADGLLTLRLEDLAENQVVSLRIAPPGTWAREDAAAAEQNRQQEITAAVETGASLPAIVFAEGFEQGFTAGTTVLGAGGWTHGTNQASALEVFATDGIAAHSGTYYARFTENYWATNDCFHPIPRQDDGAVEVSAWYRFPDYEGNRNGKGIGAALIGLSAGLDRNPDRDYLSFKFGTNEQNGYSVLVFDSGGTRYIHWTDPSGLRLDVRGAWVQVGLVLDMQRKQVTARYRLDTEAPWTIWYTATYPSMDWVPAYVLISAYNQAPDWHFCVDDIEVRSSRNDREEKQP